MIRSSWNLRELAPVVRDVSRKGQPSKWQINPLRLSHPVIFRFYYLLLKNAAWNPLLKNHKSEHVKFPQFSLTWFTKLCLSSMTRKQNQNSVRSSEILKPKIFYRGFRRELAYVDTFTEHIFLLKNQNSFSSWIKWSIWFSSGKISIKLNLKKVF